MRFKGVRWGTRWYWTNITSRWELYMVPSQRVWFRDFCVITRSRPNYKPWKGTITTFSLFLKSILREWSLKLKQFKVLIAIKLCMYICSLVTYWVVLSFYHIQNLSLLFKQCIGMGFEKLVKRFDLLRKIAYVAFAKIIWALQ